MQTGTVGDTRDCTCTGNDRPHGNGGMHDAGGTTVGTRSIIAHDGTGGFSLDTHCTDTFDSVGPAAWRAAEGQDGDGATDVPARAWRTR